MFTNTSEEQGSAGIEQHKTPHTLLRPSMVGILLCGAVCLIGFMYLIQAPTGQQSKTLTVEKGMSVAQITERAKDEQIVKSALLLYAILEYAYDPKSIYAGTYSFKDNYSVFEVAQKLAHNEVDVNVVSLTIPEGSTRKDIAKSAQLKNPQFDTSAFLELTEGKEGYLFPETYFVPPQFTARDLADFIHKTYEEKVGPLRPEIEKSKLSEYQVLILASLLERETNSAESMKMVAGILENRMNIGMALQVDASLEYILEKPLKELTPEDLKIESLYNTYLHNELPPTPIGNPGLTAIKAIINPTKSSYFYYITDADGVFHYAKTFEEHKQNVAKYLR